MALASRMKRNALVGAALLAALSLAGGLGPAQGGHPHDVVPRPTPPYAAEPPVVVWVPADAALPTSERPAVEAAVSAYKDPQTGQLALPPPEAVRGATVMGPRFRAQLQAEAAVPLQETKATSPAGGFRVHLDRRFGSALIATRDASGRISVHCERNVTAPGARPAGTRDSGPGGRSRKED